MDHPRKPRIFIIAPTTQDCREIERRFYDLLYVTVGMDQQPNRPLLIQTQNPDSIRGLTLGREDLIVWDKEHVDHYAPPQFWENFAIAQRDTYAPNMLDVAHLHATARMGGRR